MNQQNTMAATAAANLVQGIATKLYGDAGTGITDLIALNNLVSSQSAELAPSNPLLAVARRNIRQFLAKASFASEMDRFSAGQCVEVMEAAIDAPPAQGIDLGQFRMQVAELLRSEFDLEVGDPEDHRHDDGQSEAERLAARIAALIDRKAVING